VTIFHTISSPNVPWAIGGSGFIAFKKMLKSTRKKKKFTTIFGSIIFLCFATSALLQKPKNQTWLGVKFKYLQPSKIFRQVDTSESPPGNCQKSCGNFFSHPTKSNFYQSNTKRAKGQN